MLETELINQRVKQSKDEEIQRGRAGEENSSREAGRQQAEHTAGKGRRGSRNWERMQEEVPPHHKISLSDDGDTGFPLLKHEVTEWKQKNKDWEEVLWWQHETTSPLSSRCSALRCLHLPGQHDANSPWPQLWSSPKSRPAQAEPWRYFPYLLWEIMTQKAFSLWDYLSCFCEEATVGTPCSSRGELFALWDACSDG